MSPIADVGDQLDMNDWYMSGRIDLPTPDTCDKYVDVHVNSDDIILSFELRKGREFVAELTQYLDSLDNHTIIGGNSDK